MISAEFSMEAAGWELLDRNFGQACTDRGFQLLTNTGADPYAEAENLAYPFTLTFENERIAVPGRGLPIQVAGRKVVKINIFLTW